MDWYLTSRYFSHQNYYKNQTKVMIYFMIAVFGLTFYTLWNSIIPDQETYKKYSFIQYTLGGTASFKSVPRVARKFNNSSRLKKLPRKLGSPCTGNEGRLKNFDDSTTTGARSKASKKVTEKSSYIFMLLLLSVTHRFV